jgi:hypothetical protein
MRVGSILSFIFHVAIVLLLIFGLPDLFASQEMVIEPVPVQLATVADLTTAPKPADTPKPAVKPTDTPPPPAPQAPPTPTPPAPPTPPQTEPAPPQPQEATTAPPPAPPTPPQPQPAEKLPDLPQPEVIPDKTQEQPPPQEAKAEAPPLPQLRPPQPDQPKPKPAKKPAQQADFNSLLKNLTNQQTASADQTPPQPEPQQPASAPSAPIGQQLTASELDAVRSQIAGCWYLDPGKKGADTLIVEIAVTLLPDGTVQSADIVDQSRMSDPVYQAAAEAAKRAILKCHQLQLPPDKYDLWKNTTFRFNPSGFFG